MDDITQQFYDLKLSLAPILAFIDEVKFIRKAHRISEESSITMMGLLSLEIKEDTLATVRTFQEEEEKRIADVEEMLKDTQKEVRDKFYDYTQTVTNLEMDLQNLGDLIARQGSFIEFQNKNFDSIKKDIGDKASSKDIEEFKKQLKRYTPLNEFYSLSSQISELASKSSFDILRKDILNIEKKIKVYVTADNLTEQLSKSEETIKKHFNSIYTTHTEFNEEKEFTVKRCDRIEENVTNLYQKHDLLNDLIKKKFREVFDLIKKRPWNADFEYLQGLINDCATKSDFTKLNDYVEPKIAAFSTVVSEINSKVIKFEKILERYDEILLDKSSKDDIRMINSKLPTFSSISQLKELQNLVDREIESNLGKLGNLSSKTDELYSSFKVLSNKFEIIRRENLEVTSISSTLHEITEKISEKADKSDIYVIYDVMGKKDDLNVLKDSEDLTKKQLETIAVITQSLCRTMLKSGESPAVTRKQRFDLYRNLANLITWITGEEPRDPHITPSHRSPVNLKTEFDLETCADILTTARLTKRYRRNVMTTSPRNKTMTDFMSLPPIV